MGNVFCCTQYVEKLFDPLLPFIQLFLSFYRSLCYSLELYFSAYLLL